jgi:hypothetical protein
LTGRKEDQGLVKCISTIMTGFHPAGTTVVRPMRTASSRAPHDHANRRLEQTLILSGSCDFEEAAEFAELLAEVFSALNAPRQRRYEQELEHLGSLPAFRFADDELLTVRVCRTSTIEVRPGGAQAPPRRGGEPLAHGARQLLRLQHAGGG